MHDGVYADGRGVIYDRPTGQFQVDGKLVSTVDILRDDKAGRIEWAGDEIPSLLKGLREAERQGSDEQQGWFTRLPTWGKVLFVIFYPISIPYGIYWMWRERRFTQGGRIALTAAGVGFLVFAAMTGEGSRVDQPADEAPVAQEAATADESSFEVPTESVSPRQEAAPVTAPVEDSDSFSNDAHRAAFLEFEKSIYSTEGPATQAIADFQAAAEGFDQGDVTLFELYSSVMNAKTACESVQRAYWRLDPPSSLPKDTRDLLKDALRKLSTSYMTQAEAFEAMGVYLDEQKMSEAEKYREKMAMAQSFNLSAIASIVEAKELLGIPLDEGR